jgi:peptidoglycan/LPS O-acetylase OafA/YrhL
MWFKPVSIERPVAQRAAADFGSTSNGAQLDSVQEPPSLGHLPAFDGVRGIAVLLVMAYHAGIPGFDGGRAGVDVFFVLSGFLITALLIDEHRRDGVIGLRAFYMRRVLRLYPALIAAVVVAIAAAAARIPIFDADTDALGSTLTAVPFTLLYTTNVLRAVGANGGGYLGHTWSLAIEEQFYLLWPIVMVLVARRAHSWKVAGWIALACSVSSALARAVLDLNGARSEMLYNATFSHVDGIFAGCALAVLWSISPEQLARLRSVALTTVAVGIAGIVIVVGRGMNEVGFTLVVLATVVLTSDLVTHRTSRVAAVLSHRSVTAIGRRSYGLYLYHWPIFLFLGIDNRPYILALAFGGTFAVAWLSYRFIEQPFLRKKDRWSPRTEPRIAR